MYILVTGGLGFIGSHTIVSLVHAGYTPIILDNLSNTDIIQKEKIESLCTEPLVFFSGDVRDSSVLDRIFSSYTIDAVLHFAALKSVGESCKNPGLYFDNNINGTIQLLQSMHMHAVQNIVFSGSATVYGSADSPIDETTPIGDVTNPYGRSKVVCEQLIQDYCNFQGMNAISLRYFNPIGAHPSGKLGESVSGEPSNVFPYIMKVLSGELESLTIFGDDYDTPDGTGVRDYIDIIDLVDGHIAALSYLLRNTNNSLFDAINLGTGRGTSVLELVETTARIADKNISHSIGSRRSGDIGMVYANVQKAKSILGREAKYTIEDSISHALKFIANNN